MEAGLVAAAAWYALLGGLSPCMLQAAAALAAAVALSSRGTCRRVGAAFAAGLYAGYTLAGAAALAAVNTVVLLARRLLPPLLLALAALHAYRALAPSKPGPRLMLAAAVRAAASPRAALALGAATGLTVFPCTGAPLAALAAAAGGSVGEQAVLLALGSAVAVAPASAVAVAAARLRGILALDRRLLDAAAAVLLLAAALYVAAA